MTTHYQGKPEEQLALDTYIKLTRAVNALEAHLINAGTMGDLTVSQFGVLEALLHLGQLSQHELGQKLLKSGGNITLVIDNLEKHGLVQRQRSKEDRRIVYVSLTDAGRHLITEIFPRHLDTIMQSMAVLSAEEQVTLGHICRKLGRAQAK